MSEYKQRPKVGVGAVVVKDNKVLLGKRKGAHGAGMWSTPGGHLEFGETVEECAGRELAEEAGLKALSLRPGTWVNNVLEADKHYVTIFVFVDSFEGELQLLEPDKCEGWEWFKWDALPSPIFPTVASFIQKVGLERLSNQRDVEEVLIRCK
ncbi:MAG: NUDIX domain-containing protein [Verrucomicrobia bacterium]|nr:NUDIX domain-containing protein [Verrucomicrobiota bacterium]